MVLYRDPSIQILLTLGPKVDIAYVGLVGSLRDVIQ